MCLCILEFQFVPLPKTNPVLIGHRWKEYHEALGLKSIVDFSWETVLREKPDMIHLLDFPYNGETPRSALMEGKVTDNKYHLCVAPPETIRLCILLRQQCAESRRNTQYRGRHF